MRTIYKKLLSVTCGSALLFSGIIHTIPAKALENGIYTATCTPYYVHPVTGVVEDSGGIESEGIGQPMTDSATDPTALIEVDPDGNIYATVRLSLMDNIENVSFMVQEDGNAPFYDVSYDIMQENLDANTTDFRMQIPSETCYLRATFYVVPMGRDVIYYIGFSDFQSGSADFITSVEVTGSQSEDPAQGEAPQASAQTEAAGTTAKVETTTTGTTSTTKKKTETTATAIAADAEGYTPQTSGISGADEQGISIYDEKGNLMQLSNLIGESTDSVSKDTEQNSSGSGVVMGILVGCGGTVVILGIAYTVIRVKRKKDHQ